MEHAKLSEQDARLAIDVAIEYGQQGIHQPSADAWLLPYWKIGRQLAAPVDRNEVLELAASTIELVDDNMAKEDYMLDSTECAGIIRAMKEMPAQLAVPVAQEPAGLWRCFHCHDVFTDVKQAGLHFGPSQHSKPACQVNPEQLRQLEVDLALYREEDTDLHRQIHALHAKHNQDVRRAEEQGYVRGLRDASQSAHAERQPCHMCGATKQPGICTTLRTCPMNRA